MIPCQDPFPIEKVCTYLWKNAEGQISFLRYAVSSSADVVQFERSFSSQASSVLLFLSFSRGNIVLIKSLIWRNNKSIELFEELNNNSWLLWSLFSSFIGINIVQLL